MKSNSHNTRQLTESMAIFILFLAWSLTMTAQPTTFTWQGKLLDNNGNAVTELSVPMTFAIFDA